MRAWQPTPVFLPGESHGQRSLAGYSPSWGHKESDTTERLTLSLSLRGEQAQIHCCVTLRWHKIPMVGFGPGLGYNRTVMLKAGTVVSRVCIFEGRVWGSYCTQLGLGVSPEPPLCRPLLCPWSRATAQLCLGTRGSAWGQQTRVPLGSPAPVTICL